MRTLVVIGHRHRRGQDRRDRGARGARRASGASGWRWSSPPRPAWARRAGRPRRGAPALAASATCTSWPASPSRSRPPRPPGARAGRPGARGRRRAPSSDLEDRDLVLVEGAGGLLVRLDDDGGDARRRGAAARRARARRRAAPGWARSTQTALTCEALRARGLTCRGVVIGAWPADPDLAARCNLEDLAAYAGAPAARAAARRARGASSRRGAPRRRRREAIELEVTHERRSSRSPASRCWSAARGSARPRCWRSCGSTTPRSTTRWTLAHEVRMRWCGPEVEVEGIVSLKTGGCPEDCHFCSQSGRFETPGAGGRGSTSPRSSRPRARPPPPARPSSASSPPCAGPTTRLMAQVREGVAAIREAVEINVACSLGILTRAQADELRDLGVHRYNHNLETARSYFRERRDHAHLGGAPGDARARARARHGGLLRRASSGWARRSSSGPSSPPSSPRSTPTRCR